MVFKDGIKKHAHFLVVGLSIVGLVCFMSLYLRRESDWEVVEAQPFIDLDEEESEESLEEASTIFVDIKGAIRDSGVYELPAESRLHTLIELAGGLEEGAYTANVNQALILKDQDLIYIYREDEVEEESFMHVTSANSSSHTGLVDLNLASLEELQTLSGIGPKKAQAIIDYREEVGNFQEIEDIMNVSGIGEKTFEQLKDHIGVH